MIRNFIDILGIAEDNDFPTKAPHELVEFSVENILPLNTKSMPKSIYQIILNPNINSQRVVNNPLGKISVLEGHNNIKILYYDEMGTASMSQINLPFNTFLEIKDSNFNSINVLIGDAYFELIHTNFIYSHILYIVYLNNTEDIKVKKYDRENIEIKKDEVQGELLISKISSKDKQDLIDLDEEIL